VALAVVTEKGLEWLPIQHGTLYLKTFVEQQPALKRVLTSSIEYQFDVDKLYLPSVPQRDAVLERTGANLAGVLDAMKNWPDPTTFESLQMSLNEAIPTLKRIVLPSATKHSAGAKAIEFVLAGLDQPPVTIPARLASTGALLLTAFLTLSYTDTPDLLLFEEPENGLHPSRLKMVVDILRKMSHGEPGGRKRQIVVTTHSPLLLNFVHPNEVRVFIRDPDTGTRVFPMTDVPDIDRLLKEFAVGELWYLLGEEKLFEGQTA
jgi:predicted ATPase